MVKPSQNLGRFTFGRYRLQKVIYGDFGNGDLPPQTLCRVGASSAIVKIKMEVAFEEK